MMVKNMSEHYVEWNDGLMTVCEVLSIEILEGKSVAREETWRGNPRAYQTV